MPKDLTSLSVDAVYFLMFEGWRGELRSNRWHYASRWARHVPVVLLQPRRGTQRLGEPEPEPEPEPSIPGATILEIDGDPSRGQLGVVAAQTARVLGHMAEHGVERPLLWCYNGTLAGLYASLPAALRVYHATENYFDYEGLPSEFLRDTEDALRLSDLVVAVSEGVAGGVRGRVPEAEAVVITNGSDTRFYCEEGERDPEVAELASRWDAVAVYAGNVNGRLDFDLVRTVASTHPRTLTVLVGPVARLGAEDAAALERALSLDNVAALGPVPVERLPAIYRTADLGLIPFKHTKLLRDNGFPLKTLEMASTGLPVVSTDMRAIAGLASSIVVTETPDAFVQAFGRLRRSSLSDEDRRELRAVCDENDYDRKFSAVLRLVSERATAPTTGVDRWIEAMGRARWHDLLLDLGRRAPPQPGRARLLAAGAWGALPRPLRHVIPASLRARVRRALLGA